MTVKGNESTRLQRFEAGWTALEFLGLAIFAAFLAPFLVPQKSLATASLAADSGMKSTAMTAKATYRFSYAIEFTKPSAHFRTWEAWIPYPAETHEQKVLESAITTELKYRITKADQFGNRFIHLSASPGTNFPLKFEAVYKIERLEGRTTRLDELRSIRGWSPRAFLTVDRKIPLNGKIAELGEKVSKGAKTDGAKLRNMYQYVVETMTYNKDGKGWGEGDAIWACDMKRGNCTDFHSLFMGMARSQKIPARFEIGFPIPPSGSGEIPGYHCWARAYDKSAGWIPVDASEAKKQGKTFEYFGYIPNDRIHFTTGRDLTLIPRQKGEPLNFMIYPYVEIDGVGSSDLKKKFSVTKL